MFSKGSLDENRLSPLSNGLFLLSRSIGLNSDSVFDSLDSNSGSLPVKSSNPKDNALILSVIRIDSFASPN